MYIYVYIYIHIVIQKKQKPDMLNWPCKISYRAFFALFKTAGIFDEVLTTVWHCDKIMLDKSSVSFCLVELRIDNSIKKSSNLF